MRYVIEPNCTKPDALHTAERVIAQLSGAGASIFMDAAYSAYFPDFPCFQPADMIYRDKDFVIAIGGDGTILRAAGGILESAVSHGTAPAKLVGINTGTLGFLAAFEATELDMLAQLETGDYVISERMLLETTVTDSSGRRIVRRALNDIFASRMNGRICDFAVSVDGREIGVFRADGIIFSTPTGSSAYALSAGGPVMEPDLLLIEMNLICPHSLFARPMLFSPQRRIEVTYHRSQGDDGLRMHVDGTEAAVLHDSQSFAVTASAIRMPFVDFKGHAFYDALNGKLMRPLKR